MLSWSQAAEAAAAGMEAGAHSCQHPQLDQIPTARLRDELYTSKVRLEDKLGIPVPGLAYPFGYSSVTVRQVAREAGYDYAYAVRNTMTSTESDPFRLPRLTVHWSTSLPEFQRLVNGQFVLSMARDRALTAGWSVVRRSKAALTGQPGTAIRLHPRHRVWAAVAGLRGKCRLAWVDLSLRRIMRRSRPGWRGRSRTGTAAMAGSPSPGCCPCWSPSSTRDLREAPAAALAPAHHQRWEHETGSGRSARSVRSAAGSPTRL